MKIKKNELIIKKSKEKDIIWKLKNVMEPFHYIMQAYRINLYLIQKSNVKLEMITDWKCYELILFNIL